MILSPGGGSCYGVQRAICGCSDSLLTSSSGGSSEEGSSQPSALSYVAISTLINAFNRQIEAGNSLHLRQLFGERWEQEWRERKINSSL